jgi:WD40 repeat protein
MKILRGSGYVLLIAIGVCLWLTAEPKSGPSSTPQASTVRSLQMSPDGKLLVVAVNHAETAEGPGEVQLYDINTRELKRVVERRPVWIGSVAFFPGGTQIAISGNDGVIRVWGVTEHKEIATLTHTKQWSHTVAFSPNGAYLAAEDGDKDIVVWETKKWEKQHILKGHTATVLSVLFLPDGDMLVSTGSDGVVSLWDLKSGQLVHQLKSSHRKSNYSLACSPDQRCLAVGSFQKITIWDLKSKQEITTFPAHSRAVHSLSFTPDGKSLVSCGLDGSLIERSVDSWNETSAIHLKHLTNTGSFKFGWLHTLSCGPDSDSVVSGGHYYEKERPPHACLIFVSRKDKSKRFLKQIHFTPHPGVPMHKP